VVAAGCFPKFCPNGHFFMFNLFFISFIFQFFPSCLFWCILYYMLSSFFLSDLRRPQVDVYTIFVKLAKKLMYLHLFWSNWTFIWFTLMLFVAYFIFPDFRLSQVDFVNFPQFSLFQFYAHLSFFQYISICRLTAAASRFTHFLPIRNFPVLFLLKLRYCFSYATCGSRKSISQFSPNLACSRCIFI